MPQKYKVFLDNNWVLFSNIPNSITASEQKSMNNHKLQIASFQELQYELSKSGSILIQSSDPYLAMKEFFKSFKFVRTAGALVQNNATDQYLWMQRFEHLDLPKGKIEKGETELEAAIREVQEETGLSGQLTSEGLLGLSYHVYEMKGKSYLKENHWFKFRYQGQDALIPQKEEGIEAVFWLSEKEWKGRLEECYLGLKELLERTC
jgi:8-oxo-dGTP pyrophosphatase MutT (NUDIX family)